MIVGLGNPLLTDDAVGLVVARLVHRQLRDRRSLDLCQAEAGGIDLVELLSDYQEAVVVDALMSGQGPPGSCFLIDLALDRPEENLVESHRLGLAESLTLFRRLGLKTPASLRVYGVEVVDPYTFGEELTPAVRKAVPAAAAEIAAALAEPG